jgi:hypothetical protein
MKKNLFIFFLVFAWQVLGQIMPYEELFFWSNQAMKNAEIKTLYAYQFDSTVALEENPSKETIEKGTLQTIETFDEHGRVLTKINLYPYSDIGSKTRIIAYDPSGWVEKYQYYEGEDLIRDEVYTWRLNALRTWQITFWQEGDKLISNKAFDYNQDLKPICERILLNGKIIQIDSITYDSTTTTRKNAKTKKISETIKLKTPIGDTTFNKEVYDTKGLIYRELHIKNGAKQIQKIEEYQDGLFYRVYYRHVENDMVIKERQIHVVPNFNFEKRYTYTPQGVPYCKKIYHNTNQYSSIVYFLPE